MALMELTVSPVRTQDMQRWKRETQAFLASGEGTPLERLQAERLVLLLDTAWTYKLALEGLTPGGSEFVDEPETCVAWVKKEHRTLMEHLKDAHRRMRAIREGESA